VSNEWIKWEGGDMPVRPMQKVEVRMMETGQFITFAKYIHWGRANSQYGIVEYRVLDDDKDQPANAPDIKSGNKYLKDIQVWMAEEIVIAKVDIYAVLRAFDVTCPATAHAVKKLLMPGQRAKGTKIQDLKEARDALNRAIQMEEVLK
jgi:hypothetical protein